MSGYQHEQQRSVVVVAVAQSSAEAEFLRVTLAAHGIQAAVSAPSSAYPSIEFVQGVQVSVSASDEEAAREILRELRLEGGEAS